MRDTKYQIIRDPKVMDTIFTLIDHNLPFTQIAEIVNTPSAYIGRFALAMKCAKAKDISGLYSVEGFSDIAKAFIAEKYGIEPEPISPVNPAPETSESHNDDLLIQMMKDMTGSITKSGAEVTRLLDIEKGYAFATADALKGILSILEQMSKELHEIRTLTQKSVDGDRIDHCVGVVIKNLKRNSGCCSDKYLETVCASEGYDVMELSKAIEFLMMNKRIYKSTKGALVSYVLK